MAEEEGVSYDSCQTILTKDIGMGHLSQFSSMTSWHSSSKKTANLWHSFYWICRNAWKFSMYFTADHEIWVCSYDPETKQQSSQWESISLQWPRKACQVCCKTKEMLAVFFNYKGVVHQETLYNIRLFTKHSIPKVIQHSYSQDMASGDLSPFPKLRRFQKLSLRCCSQHWPQWWNKCICAERAYFEEN